MITGNESLLQIATEYPQLIAFFEKQGLGAYFDPHSLRKIGPYLSVNTLLKSKDMNANIFLDTLNEALDKTSEAKTAETKVSAEGLHFSAMLPCGLRNPFKEFFETLIQENEDYFDSLNYLIEGNVNHELSYYPLLDNITDLKELPDMIMASDVNNFFHRPFMERFIKKGIFTAYKPYEGNTYLEKSAYSDPQANFTMFTANMLVMAVDKEQLGDRKMPSQWSDLLSDQFYDSIVMRGEDDFFCNAVMLPFYKEHGFEAIKKLASNIAAGMHPAQMVKLAGSKQEQSKAVYILPYFFAKKIKKSSVEIVWPSDGAIASPVFLLLKKEALKKHQTLLDLLTSKKMGQMLQGRLFPSMHPELSHEAFPEAVKWLGWDFIYNHDIGQLKDEIRNQFMEIWTTKNHL